MLLAIDIGNTTTKFAIFRKRVLSQRFTHTSLFDLTPTDLISILVEHGFPPQVRAVYISSVVKEIENFYREFSTAYSGAAPVFVDYKCEFGFYVDYHPPESCGADRLVAAFAAKEKFGAPAIVCDFGTATTIDFISSKPAYKGGIIAPGINTLASALFEKTSKLPNVELEIPNKVISHTTVTSIQSGIYFGYVSLVDGLIERMFEEAESETKVISTGGFAELISQHSRYVKLLEPNLILEGLYLLHKKREAQ
ncbi:MAG: type III pantothenate kinase [Pyrinomonadaceae bacterium]